MLKSKLLTVLKSMKSDYPNVLSNEKMFKALARDLLENNVQYNAIVRYLCIALFEYDALDFLETDVRRGENFAANNLSKKLISEGAQNNLAAEVVGYLLILMGQDEKLAAKFTNDNLSFAAESLAPLTPINFGGYEWLVLSEENGQSLLLSTKVIEKRPFHDSDTETSWEACTLRKHLNSEFLNGFRKEEKSRIIPCETGNGGNPWFVTKGGNNTTDKVFLLSLDEVVRYFGDSGQLRNPPAMKMWLNDPAYNKSRIAYDNKDNAAVWWLRSSGDTYRSASAVMGNGFITPAGFCVSNSEGGIRPAMWAKID